MSFLNPFLANFYVLYLQEATENQRFSGVFRVHKIGMMATNDLIIFVRSIVKFLFRYVSLGENCPCSKIYCPYFPAFGLNAERFGVSLCIQSEYGKIWTWKTQNTDTFHAVRGAFLFTYFYSLNLPSITILVTYTN